MESFIPLRRLYKMALYTSTAIGVLVVEPLYIAVLNLAPGIFRVAPLNNILLLFLLTILGGSIVVFIIWFINIQLIRIFTKVNQVYATFTIRYISSYVICFTLFLGFRFFIQSLIIHPLKNESFCLFMFGRKMAVCLSPIT